MTKHKRIFAERKKTQQAKFFKLSTTVFSVGDNMVRTEQTKWTWSHRAEISGKQELSCQCSLIF